jgi:hypothetical protein
MHINSVRNVSLSLLMFNIELDNDHYDAWLLIEEQEEWGIFSEFCFYRQPLPKVFPIGGTTTWCILLLCQV